MEQVNYQKIIKQAYHSFNERNIDAIFSLMIEHVCWPNGWEGGYVKGQDEVRDYWTRQWKEINPVVTPVSIKKIDEDKFDVKVHQVVKDLNENILYDGIIHHIYTFEKGMIKSMEIVK